ncbi:MAG: ComF family protein [Magnetococcales bacterium]|nr:ComF family protein [Magnetococcales bacterium]
MIRARFSRLVERVGKILFPPVCPLCAEEVFQDHRLCEACRRALPPMPEKLCLRCGELTARPEQGCGHCLDRPDLPDAAFFAFPYEGEVKELIVGFKFSDRSERARLLGDLCWERLGAALAWENPDVVIPMPLHAWRLLGRRYNQSALLGGVLAGHLRRPLITDALLRVRKTRPQTRLNARERRENVQGAFRATPARVMDRSVLLVDDVMTTGATLYMAAGALKQAGAGRVAGVCLARVDPRTGSDSNLNQGVMHG